MGQQADIRDADLLDQLEAARGAPGYSSFAAMLATQQQQRDTAKAQQSQLELELASLTPVGRRRHQAREAIQSGQTPDNVQHIHSVLALCGLPYRALPEGEQLYVRSYGRNKLTLSPGPLMNPTNGEMEMQGLPYGPKARLLLLHLCTEAVRQKSPQIEIAHSLSAFIREMGFEVTGGTRGTLTQFKEQLNRLAGCQMRIGMWDGEGRARTINTTPIEAFDVWLPRHPDQKLLWSSTVTFDPTFFKSLTEHALPVDIRAVRAFAGSARKLDLVFWIGYRLHSIDKPFTLNWAKLAEQFGNASNNPRRFKQHLKDDIAEIREVFPKLPVELSERGLTIYPRDANQFLVRPKRQLIPNKTR